MKGFDRPGGNQAGKAFHAASRSGLDTGRIGGIDGTYRWRNDPQMLRIGAKPVSNRVKLHDIRDVSAYQMNLFLTGSVIGLIIGLGWLVSHG